MNQNKNRSSHARKNENRIKKEEEDDDDKVAEGKKIVRIEALTREHISEFISGFSLY